MADNQTQTQAPDWQLFQRLNDPRVLEQKQKQLYAPLAVKLLRYFAWLTLLSSIAGGIVLGRGNAGFGVSVVAKGFAGWLLLLAVEVLIRNIINIRELLEALVGYAAQQ
jgi:hypothetical protein